MIRRLLAAVRAFWREYNRREIICTSPQPCGKRINGKCELAEPCENARLGGYVELK
jgi:hypothetical protein